MEERIEEIKILEGSNVKLESAHANILQLEQDIARLKEKEEKSEVVIQQLSTDLASEKIEKQLLEQKIREELKKQEEKEKQRQESSKKPKRPKDIDEFRDYLGYNFENLGIQMDSDFISLLKDHLCKILFQGKPIIICRNTGFALMRCVSNVLVKTPDVPTLVYSDTIGDEAIDSFLSQDKRVICLDNFIGNYNETTLVTVCDRHRDKIIFLTVTYDHTLAYVPNELMQYCHYLNLNRIEGFINGNELTEDPSSLEEDTIINVSFRSDTRWSPFMGEMLNEIGLRGALSAHKQSQVSNETILCCLLAFDVLPYCIDVMKIKPFALSERLVKYTGERGRCPHKSLFRRWFS